MLADLGPGTGLLALARLEQDLTAVLGRKVDVVPARDLKPDLARGVFAEAIPL